MSNLKTYLRSGYAALYAVTHEEERITKEIAESCEQIDFKVYTWSPTHGIITPEIDKEGNRKIIEKFMDKPTANPGIALACYMAVAADKKTGELVGKEIPSRSVLVMQDFHLWLKKGDPVMIRQVKDAIGVGRTTARSLMVMGCRLTLPPELEKEFTVVDFPLPSRETLLEIAEALAKQKGVKLNGGTEAILEAGVGLTTNEFADAAAASLTEHDDIVPSVIASIKADTIKKSGILEIVDPGVTFDKLGGLGELKSWVTKRRNAFGKKAEKFGLPIPKGAILFGVMGDR